VVSGSGGVRLYDGKIVLGSPVALTSQGFNVLFGTQLDYNSTGLGANIGFGKNWVSTGALGGLEIGSGNVLYKQGANSVKYFYPTSGGDYATTYFVRDRLFKKKQCHALAGDLHPDSSGWNGSDFQLYWEIDLF
jgi:hypothetical protein